MASRSLGTLTVDFIAKIGGFKSGMTEAERASEKAAKKILADQKKLAARLDKVFASIKLGAVSAFAGISLAVGAAFSNVFRQMEKARDIQVFAGLAGTSVEAFQKMAFAAETVNIPMEKMADMMKDFNEKLGEFKQVGSGGFADFFKQIAPFVKITADELAKLSGEEALLAVVASMEEAGLTSKEMSFYLEALGSDMTNLLPLLVNGGKGLKEIGDRASEAGAVMSSEFIQKAQEAQKELDTMKFQIEGVRNEMALAFIPVVKELITTLQPLIQATNEWAKQAGTAREIADVLQKTLNVLNGVLGASQVVWGIFNTVIGSTISLVIGFISQLGIAINTVVNFVTALKNLDFTGKNLDFTDTFKSITKGFDESARSAKATWASMSDEYDYAAKNIENGASRIGTALDGNTASAVRLNKELKKTGQYSSNQVSLMPTGFGDQGSFLSALKNTEQAEKKSLDNRRQAYEDYLEQQRQAEAEAKKKSGRSGGGSAPKTPQISEEEKEQQRLQQEYERTMESMKKRQWMLGKEGQLAELTYETQFGSLQKMTEQQKQSLLAEAALLEKKEEAWKKEDERKKEFESNTRRAQWFIENLDQQLLLLGKTADEQERLNMLRDIGANADAAVIKQAEERLKVFQEASKAMEAQIEIADTMRNAFQNSIEGIVNGTMSLKDAFKSFFDALNAQIIRMITQNWSNSLFGEMGSGFGGSSGGFFSNLFGMFGFGGGKAIGGLTLPNTMYRVNEQGPEMLTVKGKDYLMMGSSAGMVTPNHRLKGGNGVVQNNSFVIQGRIDRRTELQIAQEVGRRAQVAQNRNH